jgi:hypothetical protein
VEKGLRPAFLTGSRSEVMDVVADARLATEDDAVVFTVRQLTDRGGQPSVTQPREVRRCPPTGDSRPGAARSVTAVDSWGEMRVKGSSLYWCSAPLG